MLTLHGYKIDYEELMAMLPADGNGVSLHEMQDAARALGIDAQVVHGSYEQLRRAVCPLIVHLKPPPGKPESVGHYVVVLNVTDERVSVLDAQVGGFSSYTPELFQRLWSGYALRAEQPAWNLVPAILPGGALCLAVLTAGFTCRAIRRRARDFDATRSPVKYQ